MQEVFVSTDELEKIASTFIYQLSDEDFDALHQTTRVAWEAYGRSPGLPDQSVLLPFVAKVQLLSKNYPNKYPVGVNSFDREKFAMAFFLAANERYLNKR